MSAFMVRSLPSHILSLSDQQLYEKLRSYIPNVGPVLPSTRGVYERKLYAIETGQAVEAVGNFSSADEDDDEDDEPQTSRTPPPPQPRSRTTVTQRAEHPIERSEIRTTYARRPLHSGIGDSPSSRFPAKARKGASPTKRERAKPAPTGRHWLWLLLLFMGAALVLIVYLSINNMEANPESNIPDRIDMQED